MTSTRECSGLFSFVSWLSPECSLEICTAEPHSVYGQQDCQEKPCASGQRTKKGGLGAEECRGWGKCFLLNSFSLGPAVKLTHLAEAPQLSWWQRRPKPKRKLFKARGTGTGDPRESENVREIPERHWRRSRPESVGICTSPVLTPSCEYTEEAQRGAESLGKPNQDRKCCPQKAERSWQSQPHQADCLQKQTTQNSQRT